MKIPSDKVKFWKEPDSAPAAPDKMAVVLEGVGEALRLVAESISMDKQPAQAQAAPVVRPTIQVNVPDRPRKWLFTVSRDRSGNINTVDAEALD